ncbi:hypothetical protein VTO42DRAFT_7166 [Malbranchea cinnamomea]
MLSSRHTSSLPASSASILSSAMTPTARSSSPPMVSSSNASSRQRKHRPTPSFHLDNLPRFHPAVYQSAVNTSSTGNHSGTAAQSAASSTQHRSSQPQHYRLPSDAVRQYRDFVCGISRTPSTSSTSSTTFTNPAKPRLDPLGSPGPVTPLALEEDEQGGYLATGLLNKSHAVDGSSGSVTGDLVKQLMQQDNERFAAQSGMMGDNKGR